MTAVDLLARFFAAVNQSPLTYHQAGTLIAIAAGLDTAEDIRKFLGMKLAAGTGRQLKELTKLGFVDSTVDPLSEETLYHLTPNGCNAVREILHFIPAKQ